MEQKNQLSSILIEGFFVFVGDKQKFEHFENYINNLNKSHTVCIDGKLSSLKTFWQKTETCRICKTFQYFLMK